MKERKRSNDAENIREIESRGWTVQQSPDGWYRAGQGGFYTEWKDNLTAVAECVKLLK
jgi:hypothetical protein